VQLRRNQVPNLVLPARINGLRQRAIAAGGRNSCVGLAPLKTQSLVGPRKGTLGVPHPSLRHVEFIRSMRPTLLPAASPAHKMGLGSTNERSGTAPWDLQPAVGHSSSRGEVRDMDKATRFGVPQDSPHDSIVVEPGALIPICGNRYSSRIGCSREGQRQSTCPRDGGRDGDAAR
jgi:hypothetical protein